MKAIKISKRSLLIGAFALSLLGTSAWAGRPQGEPGTDAAQGLPKAANIAVAGTSLWAGGPENVGTVSELPGDRPYFRPYFDPSGTIASTSTWAGGPQG